MKPIKSTLLAALLMLGMILTGLLITAAVPSVPGVPADSTVSQLGAVTTLSGTDVLYVVASSASKKISWSSLMSIIRDSLEAQGWNTTGDWQFVGGYFNAGSDGEVYFADSVTIAGPLTITGTSYRSKNYYPSSSNTYNIGQPGTNRWLGVSAKYMYADNFIITNPASPASDTVIISYDGDKLQFNAQIVYDDSAAKNIGDVDFPIDTLYSLGLRAPSDAAIVAQYFDGAVPSTLMHGVLIKPVALHYRQAYSTDASTTSLTLKSAFVELNPSAGGGSIDTLYVDDALFSNLGIPIITIYNRGSNSITITDTGGAGFKYCMRLRGGDVTLTQYDTVRLIYDVNAEQWIQIAALDVD